MLIVLRRAISAPWGSSFNFVWYFMKTLVEMFIFVPRLSPCPSVRHKNFNLAHIFWSINDRALIFGMHDPCDRPFQLTPCLDLDLWPTSRSNLLPGGGPPFSEFACLPFPKGLAKIVQWPIDLQSPFGGITVLYWTKKESYIKFSLKLRIFHLNIVKECIVIYNHQCFMVDMSCRGNR